MNTKDCINWASSSWINIKAGVRQSFIIGSLLFLIYVNDLADDLYSNTKIFTDDTSLFSVIHDSEITTSERYSDLATIEQWAIQWKES